MTILQLVQSPEGERRHDGQDDGVSQQGGGDGGVTSICPTLIL